MNLNGSNGGGGTASNPSSYGQCQSYMSPYSSGVSPGVLPYQAPTSEGYSSPPDQYGTNMNVQACSVYYTQPFPNEEQRGNIGGPDVYGGGGPHRLVNARIAGSRKVIIKIGYFLHVQF